MHKSSQLTLISGPSKVVMYLTSKAPPYDRNPSTRDPKVDGQQSTGSTTTAPAPVAAVVVGAAALLFASSMPLPREEPPLGLTWHANYRTPTHDAIISWLEVRKFAIRVIWAWVLGHRKIYLNLCEGGEGGKGGEGLKGRLYGAV